MKRSPHPIRLSACLCLTMLAAFPVLAAPACADDSEWHWLWVVPSNGSDMAKPWSVFSGEAKVHFDGQVLDAKLDGHGDWDPVLQVRGRVTGRKVTIELTQLGTDADSQRYDGEYSSVRTPRASGSAGWGEDRIAARSGLEYLAFDRAVRSQR